jgi:hypothetical protein
METGVHGRIGIHVQRHVVVDQDHDIMNVTVQSLKSYTFNSVERNTNIHYIFTELNNSKIYLDTTL